jgi:hypothetical protein
VADVVRLRWQEVADARAFTAALPPALVEERGDRELKTSSMTFSDDVEKEGCPYRTVSKTAVISLLLSFLSITAFLATPLLAVPLLGFFMGLYAYRTIRRYPDELSGMIPALAGSTLCALLFLSALTVRSIIYATEVPEGYERISFEDLQPSRERREWPVSAKALSLDGKRVFVKGYVYPDGQQSGIKRFVLVRDLGTCCFGGQPKLTHMIEVTLEDPLRIEYALRKRKLGGILTVDTNLKPVSGVGGVYFRLGADYLR